MKIHEEKLDVGRKTLFPADAPNGAFSVFFEDDGETGYFYAIDLKHPSRPILDGMHIYNVANVVDRDRPSTLSIVWSDDGVKCALLINSYSHAVFDFGARRGYCRTNFPNFADSPEKEWLTSDHTWSDEAASWLKKHS